MSKVIKHIGIPRRSGRYPWGSGEDPQRSRDFLGYVAELSKQGFSEKEIANNLGLSTTELRERRSIAKNEKRAADTALALRLRDKGYSNVAIGERMSINESSVRALLNPALKERAASTANTAHVLRNAVAEKQLIDVGIGVERHLGVSRTKLNNAVAILKEEGYEIHVIKQLQPGTGKYTNIKVLAPPGMSLKEVSKNREQISVPFEYSEDGGRSFLGLEPIRSVSRDRVLVRYGDEGGSNRDGVIQLRPGVPDIDLGHARYAQVRIGVGEDKFMKGMAMYGLDIPDGYDIVYNTNKPKGSTDKEVFKSIKDDPDNPFKTTVRQTHYIDENGVRQLSALNKVGTKPGSGEEGSWETWSKNLSSQFLSKQPKYLIKQQLDLDLMDRDERLKEIMSITNPTIKKKLLQDFADASDKAAVDLQAHSLPRQSTHVLLPVVSLKDNEIYAPNFRPGETVVLIRHPHGGIFEIPELKVNNKNPEGRALLGQADDAVGVNPNVAKKLSGADFDGDTAIVIPNNNRLVQTSKSLNALKDFEPKIAYKGYEGMSIMSDKTKQLEMGKISNLITDMTIKGATQDEIARAVKHSMVVIDAVNHKLNYKQSALDNNIADLKKKYQGRSDAGASTLISRAGSKTRIPEREEGKYVTDPKTGKKRLVFVDPDTGEKLYRETGRMVRNKKGELIVKEITVPLMSLKKNANELSSGTEQERLYADYANTLKRLAKESRIASLSLKDIPYSHSAREAFKDEVESLNRKLTQSLLNKPLERKAIVMAGRVIAAKRQANPDLSSEDLKKIRFQALTEARNRYKSDKTYKITFTDKEWLAIQAGAISPSKLKQILDSADEKSVSARALPKEPKIMSPARTLRVKTMAAAGYTRSEIADAIGVSTTTIANVLKEGE